jgi:putative MATE family efflux protein
VVSHAAGRKDRDRAVLLFNQSQVLSLVCGVIFLLVMMGLRVGYTRVLSADATTAALAADYLLWFIPAMSLQFAMVAMGSALRGTGNFKPGMIVQTTTVVVNMLLAPILIFGWFTGYPMGVAGAALSTLVAVVVGVLWLSRYFTSSNEFLHYRWADWPPRFETWASMLKIGLPAGVEFALTAVYLFVVYTVCRPFGASAQAAFGIGLRLVQSMFLPVVALAFAAGPVAGQNVGARKADRVRTTFLSAVGMAAGITTLSAIVGYLEAERFMRIFSQDPEVVQVGVDYLHIAAWSFVASGVVFVSSSMFQALGNAVPPMLTSISRIVLISVPIVVLSQQPGFSLKTIWYISVCGTALQMIANLALLQREFHKRFAPQLATDQPSLSA